MAQVTDFLVPIAAVAGAITGTMSYLKSRRVQAAVTQVHLAVNGRVDAMLALVRAAAEAEGRAELEKAAAQAARELAAAQVARELAAAQGGSASPAAMDPQGAIDAIADKLKQ